MMQATRQRILDYLDQNGAASPRQLGLAFGMTAANLRRHLNILLQRGLIMASGRQPTVGRGRPRQLFALAPAAKQDGLETLARSLLKETDNDQTMKALAARMLGESGDPLPSGQTQRLVNAVQRLARLHYKPHWEARPQGPQVVFGFCPYATIIADHPELCRMDASMLQQLLGSKVEQSAKLQTGPQGVPQCVFMLMDF